MIKPWNHEPKIAIEIRAVGFWKSTTGRVKVFGETRRLLPSVKYAAKQRKGQETMARYSQHTFGSSLLSVGLHGDVGVEMVQSAVGLFTTVPATLVHALDLLISSSRTLVLLRAGDGHERVNLVNIELALANARRSFMVFQKSIPFFPLLLESPDESCFFFFVVILVLASANSRARNSTWTSRQDHSRANSSSTTRADKNFFHVPFLH